MKKLAFLFAAVVAVSFASCGQNTEQGSCGDSCEVAVEETVCSETPACPCDSCQSDSCQSDTCVCAEVPAAE